MSDECIEFCGARTPNGCDCFGCCTIQYEGESIDILTTTGCSAEELDDEGKCPRCTKTSECENTCGECELCPGRTVEDSPESCAGDPPDGTAGAPSDPPPGYTCDNGTVCETFDDCPSSYYCSLGCCLPSVERRLRAGRERIAPERVVQRHERQPRVHARVHDLDARRVSSVSASVSSTSVERPARKSSRRTR